MPSGPPEHALGPDDRAALERLAALALERRLGRALERILGALEDWRAGRLSASEAADLLHDFDHHEAGRLRADRDRLGVETYVALAAARGVLRRADLGPRLAAALAPRIDALRELDED